MYVRNCDIFHLGVVVSVQADFKNQIIPLGPKSSQVSTYVCAKSHDLSFKPGSVKNIENCAHWNILNEPDFERKNTLELVIL